MSLETLACLFTLGVFAHNTEEAFLLPAWSQSAGRWHAPVGAREFAFAVSVLSLVLVFLTWKAITGGAQTFWANAFTGYVFAMMANVFLPHAVGTVLLRRYMPGLATGLLLNLPLGGLFIQQALAQGFVDGHQLVWFGPLTAVVLVVSIPPLFAAGRWLSKQA